MGDFDFKTTSFEFKGFKEMYRAIDHLPEVVLKKELEPILVRALEPMRAYAHGMAPDDVRTSNPDLESSIVVSTRQRSGPAKRDRALGRFDARAYVGPSGNTYRGGRHATYPQAMLTEFGHLDRGGGHVGAQPYMRPAWDTQKTVALKIIGDLLGDRLMLIAKKYGPKG
jgi:hypothetical protein